MTWHVSSTVYGTFVMLWAHISVLKKYSCVINKTKQVQYVFANIPAVTYLHNDNLAIYLLGSPSRPDAKQQINCIHPYI